MSKDEIKTIRNNSAIIFNPDLLEDEQNSENGLTQVQIQTLIKSLQSISFKQQPPAQAAQAVQKVKEVKADDTCLGVNKLWYEQYSCYIDSVLFTLFSFPK
jgi:hypothetical protein